MYVNTYVYIPEDDKVQWLHDVSWKVHTTLHSAVKNFRNGTIEATHKFPMDLMIGGFITIAIQISYTVTFSPG